MITDKLAEAVRNALEALCKDGSLSISNPAAVPISIEIPGRADHGDYACNVCLVVAREAARPPREVAALLQARLADHSDLFESVTIAGPGFLNLVLNRSWMRDLLVEIEEAGAAYGASQRYAGANILIEFVSANPTGPISVVNGRAAAVGDVLANLLQFAGAKVSREFYVNDALNSTQLERFALSVRARYLQALGRPLLIPPAAGESDSVLEPGADDNRDGEPVVFPVDGYRGEYVRDIARQVAALAGRAWETAPEGEALEFFRTATLEQLVAAQHAALLAFGVKFDVWFYESMLYASGAVDTVIHQLKERGCTYELDSALWLRSSEFGDEKDRVLIRSNDKPTYVAADIAYHHDKFRRGFNRLLDIWGADHHGYVQRLTAGVVALGYDREDLEIILHQMVCLLRDGEAVMGGKRDGVLIELETDLVNVIGRDAARFYFLLASHDTPATVDVDLAQRESAENPVYYVQYAHARLSNILEKAAAAGLTVPAAATTDPTQLGDRSERDLARMLAQFPQLCQIATEMREPHRLTRYCIDLASALNTFYEHCRVLPGPGNPQDERITEARLALVAGVKTVLANALALLGISAPARM